MTSYVSLKERWRWWSDADADGDAEGDSIGDGDGECDTKSYG